MIGCMCGDCKYPENINSVITICKNENSLNYGKIINLAWDDCDDGEVDMGESEDTNES